jgi:hypothetical protein
MINYYKGKQIYLLVDSETKKVITLVNEPIECFMRVIAPAPFYDKIADDLTNNVIETSTKYDANKVYALYVNPNNRHITAMVGFAVAIEELNDLVSAYSDIFDNEIDISELQIIQDIRPDLREIMRRCADEMYIIIIEYEHTPTA